MTLKIKRLSENATIPKYAKPGDAAMDLVATSKVVSEHLRQLTFGTGLAVEIPEGFVGLIFPRSSVSKTGLQLANSVGVIDSGYRGEIMIKFNILEVGIETYNIGDRIAQLMIVELPKVSIVEVSELSDSDRGSGGFGSTGK
jgi:dUTP pyrophosphatase